MRNFTVELNPERDVTLEVSAYDRPSSEEQPTSLEDPRAAVIICPGGGYEFLSQREADPVAAAFLAEGFNAFVLRYSILEYAVGMNPVLDAARAVRWVRAHADELGVDPGRVAVLGFSAGGHVTAMLGTAWHDGELVAAENAEYGRLVSAGVESNRGLSGFSSRPDAIVACYAVFSLDWVEEDGMGDRLDFADTIAAVSPQTPPTFLWTTNGDDIVPPSQSMRFATALAEQGVDYEYHHYTRGPHGLSTATPVANADRDSLPENARTWLPMAFSWLRATWQAR